MVRGVKVAARHFDLSAQLDCADANFVRVDGVEVVSSLGKFVEALSDAFEGADHAATSRAISGL